jgi:hypothetical protein
MTAQQLADSIGQFVSEHSGDRQVMPVLSQLRSVQEDLKRIAGVKDTSNPSPGKRAAQRANVQSDAMPAGLKRLMQSG